jgi:hypothetical protein
MSGGEPLWRRVAGLYLSGIPADAKDRVSTRTRVDDGATGDLVEDPTREIIMLGEALDLVTLAQGYRSPAVPLLLRALIRIVRQVSAERAEAAAEEAAPVREAAPAAPTPDEAGKTGEEAPPAAGEPNGETDEASLAETTVSTEPPSEPAAVTELETDAATGADRAAALEERVTQTDRKVAALTAAVGQLVDVLQRRTRNGGDIERRATPRLPGTHATVFVHDQPYEVVNWSQGGFLIRIAETDRFSRAGFDFHFVLELPDETVEFQGRARPVRIERTTLAAEFATLDETVAARIGEIATGLSGVD